MIADEADGVDRFVGWPCGDHYTLAPIVKGRGEELLKGSHYSLRLLHTALTYEVAR